MHIKCLQRGTGSAGKAAGYLVGERDAMGREREGVEVLRGDPDMVAAVADSLEFEHRYRSIVIAWAPEDRPADAQINAVLDEFEKTAWAGLEPDRYSWTAVLHREHGGGVHVHILTARCDLETGKSLNIAPPGWQKTFDPLRDAFNHEHGWSRPDDPRELIRDYLVQRVEHGVVQSRADVVSTLEDAGFEVSRQGKSYVTAHDPESGKRWRLKGALYEHDFNPERIDVPAPPPAERPAAARVDPAAGGRPEPFARHCRRELGGDALAVDDHRAADRGAGGAPRGHRGGPRDAGPNRGDDVGAGADGDRRRSVRGAAGLRAEQSALDRGRAACLEAVERVRALYDRARMAVDGGLGEVVRAVRDGTAAALRAGRSLAAALRVAGRGEQDLAAANRAALGATEILGRGLQDARRDVARAVELMQHHGRQRGPERDHGPSR